MDRPGGGVNHPRTAHAAPRYSTTLSLISSAKSFGETTSNARSGGILLCPRNGFSSGSLPRPTKEPSGFRMRVGWSAKDLVAHFGVDDVTQGVGNDMRLEQVHEAGARQPGFHPHRLLLHLAVDQLESPLVHQQHVFRGVNLFFDDGVHERPSRCECGGTIPFQYSNGTLRATLGKSRLWPATLVGRDRRGRMTVGDRGLTGDDLRWIR